jgi:Type II restriction endonuclease EcoO109I
MKNNYEDYHRFLTEEVVTPFYEKRLEKLLKAKLSDFLEKKNPYLLKAKNLASPHEVVRSIVDAFLSSQEETMFGNLLETFAIYVAEKLYKGFKSNFKSIDLEFENKDNYFIVGIKSGTNWGNADQINAMKDNFKIAKKQLKDSGVTKEITSINGCMYGKDSNPLKNKKRVKQDKKLIIVDEDSDKVYYKHAGQDFWCFLTGDENLYIEIIKPIGEKALERDEAFKKIYDGKINEMSLQFGKNFLDEDGQIDWTKLIEYVSKKGKREKLK